MHQRVPAQETATTHMGIHQEASAPKSGKPDGWSLPDVSRRAPAGASAYSTHMKAFLLPLWCFGALVLWWCFAAFAHFCKVVDVPLKMAPRILKMAPRIHVICHIRKKGAKPRILPGQFPGFDVTESGRGAHPHPSRKEFKRLALLCSSRDAFLS